MSAQKKKMMRRKLAQAYQHQMRTVELLVELGEIFGEFHMDYYEQFLAISQMSMTVMKFIKSIGIHAWGYFPEDINKWLK